MKNALLFILTLYILTSGQFLQAQERSDPLSEGDTDIDYLIITSESLKPAFGPLLEWKYRKGLSVEIVSVESIYAAYQYATPQLSIKYFIYDKYVKNNVKWVLLGGDHTHVPVQYAYGKFGEYIEDFSIPTDLFYACFEKRFDWDSDQDNILGEPYVDANDVTPDIFLTRIPVRNAEDVRVFVDKTIAYETLAPGDSFYDRLLLTGVMSLQAWNDKSDNHHRSEFLYENYIEEYWQGKKYGYYDTGTDFPEGSDYNVTAQNFIKELNRGYAYVHFAGHGNLNSFNMEYGESFTAHDAAGLEQSGYSILLSTACDVSAFDSIDPCLAEAFLRNKEGGAIAVFASSRYGIELEDQSLSLGPSFHFNARFLKNLLSEKEEDDLYSFGAVSSQTKTGFLGNGFSGGAYWYLMYAINPLGDPEMPLFNRTPDTFTNVRIYRMGRDLTVNTGGVENSRICISRYDDDMRYQEVRKNVSYATFENVPDDVQVTISKPNYIPYVFISDESVDASTSLRTQINVYPNPVLDILFIQHLPAGAVYSIYSTGSTLVKSGSLQPGMNQIDLSALDPGTYILNILTKDGSGFFKIICL